MLKNLFFHTYYQSTASITSFILGSCFYTYLAKSMILNFNQVIRKFPAFLAGYFCLSMIVSIIYCYILGPIKNPRAHKAIEFSIKFVSITLIYIGFSSKWHFAAFMFLHFSALTVINSGISQLLKKGTFCTLKLVSCFFFLLCFILFSAVFTHD